MNAKMHDRTSHRSLWKGPALISALILLIPTLGNRLVDGWNWNAGDFVVVGAFVFAAAFAYELITKNVDTLAYRSALGIALVAALLLFWVNAVQTSEDVDSAAFMYFGVPIVGIVGAAVARLRPNGMTSALFATALAQALVLVVMFTLRSSQAMPWEADVLRGFALNAFFLVLFVASALLFRKAARGN